MHDVWPGTGTDLALSLPPLLREAVTYIDVSL